MEENSEVDRLLEDIRRKKTKHLVVFSEEGQVLKKLDEEEIQSLSKEIIDYLIGDIRKYKDFGMSTKVLQQLIDLKKAYWPATQMNKNMNVTVFDEQLKKWILARQELKDENKEELKNEVIHTIDDSYK